MKDLGERRGPLSEGSPSLSKPLSSLPNFPESGFILSTHQWVRYVAKRRAAGKVGMNPGSGKFLGWRGWEDKKRSAIAHGGGGIGDFFFWGGGLGGRTGGGGVCCLAKIKIAKFLEKGLTFLRFMVYYRYEDVLA